MSLVITDFFADLQFSEFDCNPALRSAWDFRAISWTFPQCSFSVDKRGSGETNTKRDVYKKQKIAEEQSEQLPVFSQLRST